MTSSYKCDICGEFKHGDPDFRISEDENTSVKVFRRHLDMCGECMIQLMNKIGIANEEDLRL